MEKHHRSRLCARGEGQLNQTVRCGADAGGRTRGSSRRSRDGASGMTDRDASVSPRKPSTAFVARVQSANNGGKKQALSQVVPDRRAQLWAARAPRLSGQTRRGGGGPNTGSGPDRSRTAAPVASVCPQPAKSECREIRSCRSSRTTRTRAQSQPRESPSAEPATKARSQGIARSP